MKWVRVAWTHDLADEPVMLYSEIDDERWEVRKVEVFRTGHRGWADSGRSASGTGLGGVPMPPLTEIAGDPQFRPEEIAEEEFETEWERARAQP